ncbi:uncharacterized protein BDV14DRAFT_190135 [Aspergillus stella-maris]|uniref:uncharacterized protein n=1 Tax=Aspergillus stella-maris TaxID=1810926 RepID=UPI003CCD401D
MSSTIEAPRQFSQPSRKGKKAWRKNVDVTEVQEGLRLLKDEEIKGGVLAEQPSEELFVIDKKGSSELRDTHRKQNKKLLKADEILAQRSAITAVDTRKRTNSKVTDGVIEPKTKKHKSDWVSRKEWNRLKQVAKEGKPLEKTGAAGIFDPWADEADPTPYDDPQFDYLEKPKAKVLPDTLKRAPISLAANGKAVPAVRAPTAGTSYNPTFEDWDALLQEQGEKAVEEEKKRLEEERKEQERQRLIAEGQEDDGEARSDDESAWEGFESEYEKPEWLNKKRPERKTKTQRNKIKRRKEVERQAKWEEQQKKKEDQVAQAKAIAERLKNQELERVDSDSDDSNEGDDTQLRRRPLGGRLSAPEKNTEVVLPDELQDSLRLLKPEGNLLDDRFRTLIVQGKLEARRPITQPRKAKREVTEKWAYKDFKVPDYCIGMEPKSLSSNWKKLQETLKKDSAASSAPKRKRSDQENTKDDSLKKRKTGISTVAKGSKEKSKGDRISKTQASTQTQSKYVPKKRKNMSETQAEGKETTSQYVTSGGSKDNIGWSKDVELGKYIAIDCEMVGVGPNPDNDSVLARISLVNYNGDQVYDSYVRPKEMVTDWRTYVSGILPKHMIEARTLEHVQKEVGEILDGRILVGHALRNDLDALLLSHPKRDIRDTSKHPPYRKIAGGGSPRLKILASEFLGLKIQDGAHSSVEDAKATMLLYRRDKDEFEREHSKKWPVRVAPENKENGGEEKKKKKKKKKTRKR